MNVIKGMLYFILILALILIIAAATAPSSRTVERSILIDAPATTVFPFVSQFEEWKNWDPWYSSDSGQKRTVQGKIGDQDYGFSWSSANKRLGSGSVTMTDFEPHGSIGLAWNMNNRGREFKCTSTISLKEEYGKTLVNWRFVVKESFPFRLLHYLMEGWFGPDLQLGLEGLKQRVESTGASGTENITLRSMHGMSFVCERTTVKFKDIDSFCAKSYPRLFSYIRLNGLQAHSAPCAMYFSWDTENKQTEMCTAVAVSEQVATRADTALLEIGAAEVYPDRISFDMQGGYQQAKAVHDALERWIQEHNKQLNPPPMEEYLKGPYDRVDTADYHTRITYFFE